MPADRRARQLFEHAVWLEASERSRWLDGACGEDQGLRAAVERLLLADAEAGAFLDEPIMRLQGMQELSPPDRVGPYRLLGKIGQGGMGAVFKATRDDGAFDREVAVKLLAHGALGLEARRRLAAERQILASLDHPSIAQIFDGGTTGEGLPYLVMELIDGEPIDRFCEHRSLSTRGRLELFRKVCDAVHVSHQNLIVHCDLKPSNILVTPDGEPKLLDFGIAKLLRSEETHSDDPATAGRPLTPEYASPEQRRGEALSTASDVFSLGVLLYKLLTGTRPELPTVPDGEDIPPPSRSGASSPGDPGVRHLRGDLDAIVLKALRPRPEERYGSVQQLSEDLSRHLDGFPVLARRDSLRYRARKFFRRHRVAVTAAVAGLLLLVAFAASMATMAGRLARERAKLQEVVSFFRVFFERAGPLVSKGRNLSLREAVDQNAQMIADGLGNQPDVKVEIAAVLGDIYRELGQPQLALEWSDRALALRRDLDGGRGDAYARDLIQAGAALRELGRFEEAEERTRRGLERLQSGASPDPADLVAGLNHLVSLFCFQGRYADAEDDSATALQLAERHLDPASSGTLTAVANRALVLRQLGRDAQAQDMYQRAVELYRRSLGAPHPFLATLLLNLSLVQRDRGQIDEARQSLEEADRQLLEMFGAVYYARIRPLVGLAKLAEQQDRIDEAFSHYEEAIDVAIASEASPTFVLRPAVDLGELLLEHGRCGEGEALLRRGLEHCLPHADGRWRYAEVEGLLGECLVLSRPDEAEALLESSRRRLEGLESHEPEALRRALHRLSELYAKTGRPKDLEAVTEAQHAQG